MMQDMREMIAELMRNNGPSESSSAEGSAAARESPLGAEPTAARQTSAAAAAAAAAGGRARGDTCTTAAREATLREDTSRRFGVTGRRGAVVPVEVGPARGQPDQQRGTGEWGTYPGGELRVGIDLPLSRLSFKHTAVPLFSRKKPEFTAWSRDARYYAKRVGFL